MTVRPVPWLACLLPLLGVNVAYVIGSSVGDIPACIPYLEGCTSISSSGRHAPQSMVFKGTMISAGVFMLVYWVLNRHWLITLDGGGRGDRRMMWLGITASLFLVAYSTALGNIGEAYHVQRRIGVTGYFGFTFLAQLLLARRVWHLARAGVLQVPWRIDAVKIGLCLVQMALGLATIPVSLFVADNKVIENVIEWNFAIVMIGYFATTSVVWRATGFRLEPATA